MTNTDKTVVCVVFGGVSSEHEVSLRSATSVLNNIDRKKYKVHMLGITKEGHWLYYSGPTDLIINGRWQSSAFVRPAILSPDRSHGGLLLFEHEARLPHSQEIRHRLITGRSTIHQQERFVPVDVVFPVLHGKNGEDGTIQGMLALAGIPCVGSGVLGSAACMDKEVSHIILETAGIKKTKLIGVRKKDMVDFQALEGKLSSELGYPMFVKPANAGSSVGVTKVKAAEELPAAFELAFQHDSKVVVEQNVTGQEIECAVMGNEDPIASSVVGEIAPTREFYDYTGKYLDDSTKQYIPAHVAPDIVEQVRAIAAKAYYTIGCAGLARVDFFVRPDGEVVLNEINTIPGFTSISMYAKLFEASGIPYGRLVTKLIEYALEANN